MRRGVRTIGYVARRLGGGSIKGGTARSHPGGRLTHRGTGLPARCAVGRSAHPTSRSGGGIVGTALVAGGKAGQPTGRFARGIAG